MAAPSPLARTTNGLPVRDGSYAALGFRKITGAGAELDLSSVSGGIPKYANKFLVYAEGGTARWTDDGSTPSASDGMPIFDQCGEWLLTDNLSAVKFYVPNGVVLSGSFYC
jgi:hypothetical protein